MLVGLPVACATASTSVEDSERGLVEILQIIMQVILGITSVLLTLFILLHKGRGGGLSDMFGGGVGSSLGSSGVAERNLNTITVVVSLAWLASIVVLGLITKIAGI
jgi:preprotein translocase subunit SecG